MKNIVSTYHKIFLIILHFGPICISNASFLKTLVCQSISMRREIFTFFFNKYFDGSFFNIIVFGLTVNASVDSQSAVHLEFNYEKIVTFLIICCIPNLDLKYLILEVLEHLYPELSIEVFDNRRLEAPLLCLYACLSVRSSVCLSVHPSITPSVSGF